MNLPNDVARCDGIPQNDNPPKMWECFACLRRIAPRPEYCWMMGAPEFIDGKCSERLTEEMR